MNATEVTEVEDRGPAAYLAEFLGTLVLVFFITAVVSLYVSPASAQNPDSAIEACTVDRSNHDERRDRQERTEEEVFSAGAARSTSMVGCAALHFKASVATRILSPTAT